MRTKKYKRHFLSDEELRTVQLIELEMLIEVDRICKKCNIKYNIIAGTALGAVRHGGFIPWDDDADIALLRSEYEKFKEACKTELDTSRFYFQDHNTTKGYRWGYGKIRRKGTKFIRQNQEHMPYSQGVFIDIFPLDAVPDTKILQPPHNLICFLFRKAFYSKVGRLDSSGLARLAYDFLYLIPDEKLYGAYDCFIKFTNINKNSKRMRKLSFPLLGSKEHYGYLRKWYTDLGEIEFEGYTFPVMKDLDGYLTQKYGDYMTLPDESGRKVHPVTGLKLIDKGVGNGSNFGDCSGI